MIITLAELTWEPDFKGISIGNSMMKDDAHFFSLLGLAILQEDEGVVITFTLFGCDATLVFRKRV